jgi:predicted phosphodiesterase
MIVQYSSDLHLEFRPIDQIPKIFKNVGADVLILAGDICAISDTDDYKKFLRLLEYYHTRYKYIFHIAGNHEGYCVSRPTKEKCIDNMHRTFKSLTKIFPNYLYLNCDMVTVTIDKKPYTFIGATLWTKVEPNDWASVEARMNDYAHLYTYKDGKCIKFTIEEMQKLHKKHTTFIKRALAVAKGTCILITHHKPVGDTPDNMRTVFTQAYETNITDIITPNVKAVIFGHTHVKYDKTIKGVRYLSNPMGYPGQHTKYQPSNTIEIK